MTIPDTDSVNTYGGALNNAGPVEDPTTDRDAGAMNKALASVSGMTHTAVRAIVRFTAAASGGAMVLVSHDAVWGNSNSVAPTLGRTGTGIFTITWPSSVTDELTVSHTVALRYGTSNPRGSVFYQPQVVITSGNVATVYVFNAGNAASDAVGADFEVFAY